MAKKKAEKAEKVEKPEFTKYTVIRDTREQPGQGWIWTPSVYCEGTIVQGLKTADYTLVGYEDVLAVERKRNTSEFAQNILQERFEKELIRLEEFEKPYLILEFTMNDIMSWPQNSGIPLYMQRKIRITKGFILKRFVEIQSQYKTKVVLAGNYGKEVVTQIFKDLTNAKT